ncbi:MAG: tetratricopeptide repeat protein, partial [Gemmatimonadetes bacterium]|nr:tetratricopeptide repeat protein [Gemmatimonadota bacterium]
MRYLILNLWIILFLPSAGWATSDVVDSLSVLEEAVKVAPKDGDAWVVLGNLYLNAGEIEKADNAFRKGIRYAGTAEAYVGLGRAYM